MWVAIGRSPGGRRVSCRPTPLASGQAVRRLTLDQEIEGSNPSSPANSRASASPVGTLAGGASFVPAPTSARLENTGSGRATIGDAIRSSPPDRRPLMSDREHPMTTEEALSEWRAAERTVAVARRGRIAAQAAAD